MTYDEWNEFVGKIIIENTRKELEYRKWVRQLVTQTIENAQKKKGKL